MDVTLVIHFKNQTTLKIPIRKEAAEQALDVFLKRIGIGILSDSNPNTFCLKLDEVCYMRIE